MRNIGNQRHEDLWLDGDELGFEDDIDPGPDDDSIALGPDDDLVNSREYPSELLPFNRLGLSDLFTSNVDSLEWDDERH